jgi:hypothetical protein
MGLRSTCWLGIFVVAIAVPAIAKERTEHFDKDPGWEGVNNRATTPEKRTIRQDFGYSKTDHAGGKPGEIGGFITPAAEAAYYGKKIDTKTFDNPLSASGKLLCKDRQFHVLIGFFNSDTINEWRTPNSIAIRLLGRGDVYFAFVEYATARWRAGGDSPGGFATERDIKTGRSQLKGFKTGVPVEWSIKYDPAGNKGTGSIAVTFGGETSICHLTTGHKADGASFNRFGLLAVSKSAAGGGDVWLDDITINGEVDHLDRHTGWEGLNNRKTYDTTDIRPRFDFGYSPTQHAGGIASGELGGLVFRGDCRFKNKLASYGDRLSTLTLDKPLKASGKVALRRGVTDSTTLLGFYHSQDSLEVNPSQSSGWPKCFLGVVVEGPSREGFLFYPAYRTVGDGQGHANTPDRSHILPDGKAHDWSLIYDPDDRGRITVKFDGKSVTLDLGEGHRKTGDRFDRFGLITTWIDGNGQRVYFDDLTYTWEQ